jgi:DNA-directed RNA polymerase subunit beta'
LLDVDVNNFDRLRIGLASSEQIRQWSRGEVKKPETINYRTLKPEKDGLFCEKIFGPTKDWECYCGKYKRVRFKGIICERCGVEVTRAKVRRERMGHIELAAPVSHIWYFKGVPSRLGYLLDIAPKDLEKVLYFASYIITSVNEEDREADLAMLKDELESDIANLEGEKAAEVAAVVEERDRHVAVLKGEAEPEEGEVVEDAVPLADQIKRLETEAKRDLSDLDEEYEDRRELLKDAYDAFVKVSPKALIADETLYREMKTRYGNYFRGGMGAEAIKDLLECLNLEDLATELRDIIRDGKGQKRQKAVKRLKVVAAFKSSKNRPEWMILDAVPVIPPDLRPMVQLDGGRFATSDLNDLYRRVINRNNRLKRLLDLGAPEIIVNNEKRMLQEAVDALFDNGRRGRPVTGPGNRPLKSISDMLKGKQGRFRQNLLGKRVDYSGRSVIVVGPELKLHQCGLPKVMALELFKPFVMKRLVDIDQAQNIKSAKRMVDRQRPVVWDVLEEVIRDHPVLLNRAPTLHRLGIQAFEPVLVEGKAIRLHPLVCTAFNADFDGDQMAVHLPLSTEAQAEARILMLSVNNIKSPAHGRPLATPTQDMVIGLYYLTSEREDLEGEMREGEPAVGRYSGFDDAVLAYDNRAVDLQARIEVRLAADLTEEYIDPATGKLAYRDYKAGERMATTVGRVTFNRSLPLNHPFVNHVVDKKGISRIVEDASNVYSTTEMARILDEVKRLGFHYATRAGVTVSVYDVKVPEQKAELLAAGDEKVAGIEKQYDRGLITKDERHRQIVDMWTVVNEDVGKAMEANFDKFNPVYMMANSGARGNMKQIRQLAGMRGLMANPKGEILDRPIKANFREGLSVLEYFISTHGARKGLADTALRTADSGYLTRRLVDVAQDVIVREADCSTDQGVSIVVADPKGGDRVNHNLVGRCLLSPVVDPKTGEVLKEAGDYVSNDPEIESWRSLGIDDVEVRAVMTCHARYGVCQKCYGWDLASSRAVDIGTAVGIIAAQSIGEPGTQLTMRTFHTGGVAGEDITHGLPRVTELFEARRPKGQAILAEIGGTLLVEDADKTRKLTVHGEDGAEKSYLVSRRSRMRPGVVDGVTVVAGQQLTEGSVNPHDLLELRGETDVLTYIVAEVQDVYASQGVDINDKHIEVIARQMMRKVSVLDAGETDFLPGQLADRFAFAEENDRVITAGGEPAKAESVLLGITKASLATDSYLSAASFQETTRVLTDAAIAGKEDNLLGLKENVIIGKLIPAATGMRRYRGVHLTYKGQSAEWTLEEGRGALPDFAPEELKELEAMLPSPQDLIEQGGLTAEQATAFFEGLDTTNLEFFDVGAVVPVLDEEDVAADLVLPEERPVVEPVEAEDDEDRCSATTGTGSRCRNKALAGSRYCRTHEGLSVTDGLCKAVMKNGKPCPKKARDDSDYCGQHAKLAEE